MLFHVNPDPSETTVSSDIHPHQIVYRMEYNKNKAKGYSLPYDTPHQNHMKKVQALTSNVRPTFICLTQISILCGVCSTLEVSGCVCPCNNVISIPSVCVCVCVCV